MNFYRPPDDFSNLSNFYWRLRACRTHDAAGRLRWYRRIKKEKDRLASFGYLAEHLRLFCLYMANPRADSKRLDRLKAFELAIADLERLHLIRPVVVPVKALPPVVERCFEHTSDGIRLKEKRFTFPVVLLTV